jgi:hypothetical protein
MRLVPPRWPSCGAPPGTGHLGLFAFTHAALGLQAGDIAQAQRRLPSQAAVAVKLSDGSPVLPGSQSRRRPETHRQGQPLQSEARNAKNAPESTICGVLPDRPAPTGSVLWLVPISNPRSAPRRVGPLKNHNGNGPPSPLDKAAQFPQLAA